MKTIFSFEVFPPKKTMPIDTIYNTLDELKDLHPDFISVTLVLVVAKIATMQLELQNALKMFVT